MLARPLHGLSTLTMILGIFFIVEGVARNIAAFQLKPEKGWGWLIFSGLVDFVLAYLILREWPLSGAWAIGVIVGVHPIFQGWYMIMLGGVGEAVSDELEAEGA